MQIWLLKVGILMCQLYVTRALYRHSYFSGIIVLHSLTSVKQVGHELLFQVAWVRRINAEWHFFSRDVC